MFLKKYNRVSLNVDKVAIFFSENFENSKNDFLILLINYL
jgi:hypothetical protein